MTNQKYTTRREVELSSADEFGQLVASLQDEAQSCSIPAVDRRTPYRGKTARFEDAPKTSARSDNYTTLGKMLVEGIM